MLQTNFGIYYELMFEIYKVEIVTCVKYSYEEELESRICVYHKGKDIFEILEYLISIMPEYNFYLKHNTDGFADTVLYCEDKSQL